VKYSLHPGAERDLADALDFYKERAGLLIAKNFLDEFERVAALLAARPGLGTPATNGRRIFPLRVFPYSVLYRSLEKHIRVLAVRHQYRKPGHGGSRV
jgi:plasmid stabilization system protein ParE